MTYRAAIFDLDGTILNTLDDLADSLNAALVYLKLPALELETVRQMIGHGLNNLIETACDGRCPVEILKVNFKNEYRQRQLNKTVPYPGIRNLFERLADRRWALGVLSNKDHENTKTIVEHYFPGAFQIVQGALPDLPLKPDPAAVIEMVKNLEAAPRETIYVGDSAVDILTAKNANLTPLGAAWGFRTKTELIEAGAAAVFDRPIDILEYIGYVR
ncbi:MAG: HAD family hydrolase [Deltaproteobacteria bacterium]|jgi:phosphoglycolate phosphatase|nr:HAD family hydrolase [Deltaproteobacteria bacterium]